MSLQSYFNSKKFSIAMFFNQLQEITHQLSLISQLEVDKQYINAKNILVFSPLQMHEQFCAQMKRNQPYTIKKILNSLFEYAQKNLSVMYNLPFSEEAKVHPVLNSNSKRSSKNLQTSPNQSEISLKRFQSKQKLKNTEKVLIQRNQQPNRYTLTTQKKQYLENSVVKTKEKGQEIRINREKYLMETNQKSQIKCIQLLNKKRVASSGKKSQKKQQQQNNRKFNSMSKYSKITNFQLTNQKQQQKKTCRNYNDEQNENQRQTMTRLKQSLQKNQQVCQKLDHKIHEQAIQILYKVKNKRSPSKAFDPKGSKVKNNKTNKHSILDITKTVLPISMIRNEGNKYLRTNQ